MIVLNINGNRTEITGWRAWLVYAAATVVMLLFFAFLAFLFIGFSITLGVALLLIIPAVGVVALIGALIQRKEWHDGIMSQPEQYPYTKPTEEVGYRLFPDCLENDDLVFFHGTLDANRQDIIRDGFRPAPDGQLVRVTYTTTSDVTLQPMFYKLKGESDRCVFAVRFESTSDPTFCQEGPLMRVHESGPQPTVIGFMVIPFADRPT